MYPENFKNCDTCSHKGRQIFIVGSQRFSSEVLGYFIGKNTPAQWQVVKHLNDIPPLNDCPSSTPRLIFFDCYGLDATELLRMLLEDATHLLRHDVLALFNLSRTVTVQLELLQLGVAGFFYEDEQAEQLLKGICALNSGEMWVSRSLMMEYISKQAREAPRPTQSAVRLTRREKDILSLIADGASNDMIAARLFVSPHTVKTHIYNTFKKIGVKNRVQAVLWANRHLL